MYLYVYSVIYVILKLAFFFSFFLGFWRVENGYGRITELLKQGFLSIFEFWHLNILRFRELREPRKQE